MPTNKLSLNIFLSCLEAKGFQVKFYYDRVKLYVSSGNKTINLDKICVNKDQQIIIPRALLHYDDIGQMIDVHQPRSAYFGRLKNALTHEYVINYVEFAMDILGSQNQVAKLSELLIERIVFERRSRNRFYYNQHENTHYFGQRFKHSDILVLYSDRESKVASGRQCVHIEMRLYGSKILKKFDIYAIQDLIDFSHDKIWNKYLDLRDVNYTKLGGLVTEEKATLTDSSYRRHGQSYFDNFVGSQHLLMEDPNFVKAFPPIINRRMFESRLDNALQ
ncbi:hypothetical protein [Methylobacter psychrophilus]|uniref:hypothetical protein n=1 Tax=Methylobacter psychrophilus TaxID=96941 RepID=UPI0021D517D0|nr:hypothetical protein [Methylobacter psychrophilus]